MAGREPRRATELRAPPAGGPRSSDRAGRRQASRDDAVGGGREGQRGGCPRPKQGAAVPPPRRRRRPRLMTARTLFAKVWDAHVVRQDDDGPALLYVDLHLV